MKNIYKYICLSIVSSSFFLGCEVTDFDLQQNPNNLSPESANAEYLLNEVQFLFQDIMGDMVLNTDDIMRYEALTDSYGQEITVTLLNLEWTRFYQVLNLSSTIEDLAESDSKFLYHKAISKLLTGYLTITFVDYVGPIPYSQALKPNEFPNPVPDSGVDLYKIVLDNINQAIEDINAATFDVSTDLFYDSDKSKWIAFANSLKLRLLIQTRLASDDIGISNLNSEINTLLASDIIDSASEDFVYRFSDVEEPESRHPYYIRGYISDFDQYIGNYFMWMLKNSKNVRDPRIRYYIYRQSNIDPFSGPPYLACQGDPAVDFCYLGEQYWGLDHGEDRTGRGDNEFRSVYGVYPAGGAFDEDQFTVARDTDNLGGKGILPILTSSYIKFLTAEAALMLGTNGDPATLLEEAIRASMSKVLNFGDVTSSFEPTSNDVDNYITEVITNYNSAASDAERLDIIITEYYLASYGNSVEAMPIEEQDTHLIYKFLLMTIIQHSQGVFHIQTML
mgnify:FL=1